MLHFFVLGVSHHGILEKKAPAITRMLVRLLDRAAA
jgi:hypothetical protein